LHIGLCRIQGKPRISTLFYEEVGTIIGRERSIIERTHGFDKGIENVRQTNDQQA
jgi:hypothetical protein